MALVSALKLDVSAKRLEFADIPDSDKLNLAGMESTSAIEIGTLNNVAVTVGNATGGVTINGDISLGGDLVQLREGALIGADAGFGIDRGSGASDAIIAWSDLAGTWVFGLADLSSGMAVPLDTALSNIKAANLTLVESGGATVDSTAQDFTIDATGNSATITGSSVVLDVASAVTFAGAAVTPAGAYDVGSTGSRFQSLYLSTEIGLPTTTIDDDGVASSKSGVFNITNTGGAVVLGGNSVSSGTVYPANVTGTAWGDAGTTTTGGRASLTGGDTANGDGGNVEINGGVGTADNGGVFIGNRQADIVQVGSTTATVETNMKAATTLDFEIAASSTVPMFATGDANGLNLTGFTATSIVGALQENRTNIAAVAPGSSPLSSYTAGESLIEGNIVRIHAAGECRKAAYDVPGDIYAVGVASAAASTSASVDIIRGGTADVAMSGSLTLSAGDIVYLDADGLGTNVQPTLAVTGEAIVLIGYIKTAAAYTGTEGELATVELIGPIVTSIHA
jgi:hypothetical protein